MEYLFLTVLTACGSLVNFLIYRHYNDQITKKFENFERNVQDLSKTEAQVKAARMELSRLNTTLNTFFLPPDQPAKNTAVTEQDETVEFSEQNIMDIPKNVKFEVEGGDAQVPPGFEEKT